MNVLDAGWKRPPPSGVAIGVFDGVHRGHAAVIRQLIARSRESDLQTGVLTFDPHPVEILAPARAPALLTTFDRRVELLRDQGLDWVGTLDLRDIRLMSPEDFISDVLVQRASCRIVSVGDDFRFGHDRRGDVPLLEREGRRLGFSTTSVHLVSDASGVISSSRIRVQIAAGDVAGAAALLGRPHRVSGEVIAGDARGRALGFPTANMAVPRGIVIPADGIYAVRVEGAVTADGVASLGVRPTFGEGGARLLEVHLFDIDQNLYGEVLEVDFVARLRGEERFASVEDLVAQMKRDAEAARRALAG